MKWFRDTRTRIAAGIAGSVLLVCSVASFPPGDFPDGARIRIQLGTPATTVAQQLADAHLVRSSTLLSGILRLFGAAGVKAGTYEFDAPLNTFAIAYRLITGTHGVPPVRLTIPEGATIRDIAVLIHDQYLDIATSTVMRVASGREGYLFPDTYLLPVDASAAEIIDELGQNFTAKVGSLRLEIEKAPLSMAEIMTLASLVEREARTIESKKMVAGILMNRLKADMPLQVDAVFGYIFGRDTYSPKLSDLKVDSAYNTYTHKGLPPGPICNPGLDSILAVLEPTTSAYYYYLTDRTGVMRYATTFDGHQANRRQFLD